MAPRAIDPGEWFEGERVALRLLTVDDCSERYVSWLNDPEVSRYLETRFVPQTLALVTDFVRSMASSPDSYLFGLFYGGRGAEAHVGNLKIGPIHPRYRYADLSYFVGERGVWGRGVASDALRTATRVAFERLRLHRVQAGLFAGNVGSARALEKAGLRLEGRFSQKVLGPAGWEDQLWYGLVNDRYEHTEVR